MKLNQLCKLSSGVNVAKSNTTPNTFLLKATDFDEQHQLHQDLHQTVYTNDKYSSHLLQENNILILCRSNHSFWAYRFTNNSLRAVASTAFIVLKNMNTKIDPQFLVWQLNSPLLQNKLQASARGTGLQSINKQILSELEIKLPSLEIQKNMVNLHDLKTRETQLIQKIDSLKSKIIHHQLQQKLNTYA